ncbi:MAG TPA: indolepyruvate oxidoreductase subunit beta [Longimicrobiales bacterium]|nr:indolepyruvate oxidoreductase subunit beta [Longimicrobiales bacterium]
MAVTSVLIAGVGGQGVILSSEILALAALAVGHDVKQGEFHGVAQRGGAVFSHVRFGDRVRSPMAPRGRVDHLLALERLEALRYAHFVKPGGTILVNDYRVEPVRIGDDRPYPGEGVDFLAGKGLDVILVEATRRAIELGNHRAANVILLGALSTRLDIPAAVWARTLEERIPPELLELNRKAFEVGQRAAGRGAEARSPT